MLLFCKGLALGPDVQAVLTANARHRPPTSAEWASAKVAVPVATTQGLVLDSKANPAHPAAEARHFSAQPSSVGVAASFLPVKQPRMCRLNEFMTGAASPPHRAAAGSHPSTLSAWA